MKRIISLLVLIIITAINFYGQKIENSSIDEFTGQKIVDTSWVGFKSSGGMNGPAMSNMHIRFTQRNDQVYLELKYAPVNGSPDQINGLAVEQGSKLMFKSSTGEICTFLAVQTAYGEIGGGHVNNFTNGYGIDIFYEGNVDFFVKNQIELIRFYTLGGYRDIKINKKTSEKLSKIADLIIKE